MDRRCKANDDGRDDRVHAKRHTNLGRGCRCPDHLFVAPTVSLLLTAAAAVLVSNVLVPKPPTRPRDWRLGLGGLGTAILSCIAVVGGHGGPRGGEVVARPAEDYGLSVRGARYSKTSAVRCVYKTELWALHTKDYIDDT